MKQNNGFAHVYIMAVLVVVVVAISYVAINVSNEVKQQLREDSSKSSEEAAESYLGKANSQTSTSNASGSSTAKTPAANPSTADTSKQIAGNNNTAIAPIVAPNVKPPKTSIDSVRTFFAAIKSGDFVTANALMGPALASEIAAVSNTSDTTKALSTCKSNATCNLILNSFQPPSDGYKVTPYTNNSGTPGEQISFPLSKSSPLIANQIGDYNIDVFSEKYAGDIWVIQNIYINGSPLSSYF